MSDRGQKEAHVRAKVDRDDETHPRDDAERQPESGYWGGHLNTKPSADRPDEERLAEEEQSGSESEFDSRKPRP